MGLRAIEHAAGLALKVLANLELARYDKALASLSFDSDTKAQLRTLSLGHVELFGANWMRPQNMLRNEGVISAS